MKLFTVGPVDMFDEVKKFRSEMKIPYFRTKEFSDIMLDTDKLLKNFAKTSSDSKTIYLTASGSAAMEATVMNCFTPKDRLLVINGGTFGQRFVDICRIHDIPFEEIKLEYGEILNEEYFKMFDRQNFTGLLVNLHETSTGQLYDIKIISDFCRQNNLYLVVDAISTFLCDDFAMDEFGVDAMITSSQKGVCIEPGLAIVILSNRLFARTEKINSHSLYFDFKDYAKNFERGQTPFSPAVGICLQLNFALHLIEKRGLKNHLDHVQNIAEDFRNKIKELPVKIPSFPLSNAVTPIIFKDGNAYRVFETLKDRYDIFVNPTGGDLHDKVLRIAHIGQIEPEDNTVLVDCLKEILRNE